MRILWRLRIHPVTGVRGLFFLASVLFRSAFSTRISLGVSMPVGFPLSRRSVALFRWKHVHAQSFTASGYSRKTNKLRYFCSQKPLRVPNCLVIRLDPLLTPFYVGVFISQTPEHTHTVPLQSGRRSRVNKQKSCLPHCLLA